MGDVWKSIRIGGITPDGDIRVGSRDRFDALLDTGASTTVVSSKVAKEAGIVMVNVPTSIKGATGRRKAQAETGLAVVRMPGCGTRVIPVAVSDDVTRAAGASVILGHDYMQKVGMRLDMGALGAGCPRPRKKRAG